MFLHTEHRIIFQAGGNMRALGAESVDLVVTSPPYPMIEMWDKQFISLDERIGPFLYQDRCFEAFEAMHVILDEVWREMYRVMKEGAIACINIGDAVRSFASGFQLFGNHARILKICTALGFDLLPLILWRKQTNAPTKFMGSGMLPAGAYVTLEHEYILVMRKGGKRAFKTKEDKLKRRQSAYFWEERNVWFSDLWDFKGIRQETSNQELRKRSAAFPFLLPFRLVNMYSLRGDTVLDPFLGTGTTMLAAMAAGRNSVGYEIEANFSAVIRNRIREECAGLNRYNVERIENHLAFVQQAKERGKELRYINKYFGFPVVTNQEKELKLVFIDSFEEGEENYLRVSYLDDAQVQSLGGNYRSLLERCDRGGVQLSLFS